MSWYLPGLAELFKPYLLREGDRHLQSMGLHRQEPELPAAVLRDGQTEIEADAGIVGKPAVLVQGAATGFTHSGPVVDDG